MIPILRTIPRLLFLDCDGVLNSSTWWTHCSDIHKPGELWPKLDPTCVMRLHDILDRTGAVVVVSSTWRTTIRGTRYQFKREGLKLSGRQLIGVTPSLRRAQQPCIRGDEIALWLARRPQTRVERFVILDDEDDMGDLIFIGIGLAFFVGCALYAYACERL